MKQKKLILRMIIFVLTILSIVRIIQAKEVAVTSVEFRQINVTITKGQSYVNAAIVVPSNATDKGITYSSGSPQIATVKSGTITGVYPGTATITATSHYNDSKKANCTVKVLATSTTISSISGSEKEASIHWSSNADAAHYNVYRATSEFGKYEKIASTLNTTYTDTFINSEYGQSYYYKVTVVPPAGAAYASNYSNVMGYTIKPASPSIESVKKSYGRYQIKISGIRYDGFQVYSGKKLLGMTTSNTSTISLNPGVYRIKVRAYVNHNGNKVYSNFSKAVKVTAGGGIIKKTAIKKISKKQHGKVIIKLKRIGNITGYKIVYASDKKFHKGKKTVMLKKSTTTRSLNLKENKTYYIKVRTYRKVNGKKYYSSYSKTIKFKTKK